MMEIVKVMFERHPSKSILETKLTDTGKPKCSVTDKSFLEIRDFDYSQKAIKGRILNILKK